MDRYRIVGWLGDRHVQAKKNLDTPHTLIYIFTNIRLFFKGLSGGAFSFRQFCFPLLLVLFLFYRFAWGALKR